VSRRLSFDHKNKAFIHQDTVLWLTNQSKIKEETSMFQVTVDADKCTGDSNCVDTCPVGVFELQDNKAVPVNMDECLGCESCVEVCETAAITVKEV